MLFFVTGEGTMVRADSTRIFQGSNNVTEIQVVMPFSGVGVKVAFTLPDGSQTNYFPMRNMGRYVVQTDESGTTQTTNLYYYTLLLTYSVTEHVGQVGVSVNVTSLYSTGQTSSATNNLTSYTANFNVEYSALPTVAGEPTASEWQQIIDLLDTYYGTLSSEVDQAQTDITALQSDMSTAQSDIASLKSRMTTAEGDIDTLQADMTTAKSDISSLKTRMTAAEENVEELQSDMTTAKANISALQADMTEAQGDISSIETRMADAEDDISTAQSNITALQNDKQDKTDNSLDTADKTVVGAINEIYEELTQGGGVNSRLDTLEAELNVLDSRVEDVEEKTAQPLMTDFTVDVDAATATKFYNNGDSSTIPLPAGGGSGGGGGISVFSFAEATWVQQSDGTYTLTLTATQTGKSNNNYTALVAAADGTGFSLLAIAVIINTDGSLYIEGVTTPFAGRVTIIG